MKRIFVLRTEDIRHRCADAIFEAPDDWRVELSEPKKKRIQEEKYHAMIGEIAQQSEYAGKKWPAADMKRILIDEFADEMRNAGSPLHHDSRIIPSEDGRRIIQLEIHSADFYVKEAAQFIEFLNAWGANHSVIFKKLEAIYDH